MGGPAILRDNRPGETPRDVYFSVQANSLTFKFFLICTLRAEQ
jgi:hypothetical protein